VRLYQAVTLGARSFGWPGAAAKGQCAPSIVEDDVLSTPCDHFGSDDHRARIGLGGNVWLTRSVPPGTMSPGPSQHEA